MWQDIEPTRALFLHNIFKATSEQEMKKLQETLKKVPNVLMNKILMNGKLVEGSTYEDLVKGQVA